MDAYDNNLNLLLNRVYSSLEKLEERTLQSVRNVSLSMSELHMLEAIALAGDGEPTSVSAISEYLDIRLPSATLSINRLIRKGYVTKERGTDDKRVVIVKLTRMGERVEHAHRYFHRNMVHAVSKELEPDEKAALEKGLTKLTAFLDKKIEKLEDKG